MDVCLDTFEYENAFEVIDLDTVHSILQFDALGEETDIFDMTSLSTLMLLGQADTKSYHMNDSNSDDVNNDENYRLSLAYERLHTMPKLLLQLGPVITILDISHNEFEHLGFLDEFPNLTTLICDQNNITSSTHIPYMPQLDLLWMNHCKISELYPWAKRLHYSCPNLKHLSLMGNPAAPSYINGGNFYEYLQYRLFMISLFPTLVHLDDRAVTEHDRTEANRMYRRPLLERIAFKSPLSLPTYLRSVTDKVSELLSPVPPFAQPQKNIIV